MPDDRAEKLSNDPTPIDPRGVPARNFAELYKGTPAWEIGRPQPEIVRLADEQRIAGPVLDAGCGTGDNAVFLASRGLRITGIDFVPRAIERARAKARQAQVNPRFEIGSALELEQLDETYATVIDCGLFHVFSDGDRAAYVRSLARVVDPGGRVFLMCFSEQETRPTGPRRVTQREIRASFENGWQVVEIQPARFSVSRNFDEGARAWLAEIARPLAR